MSRFLVVIAAILFGSLSAAAQTAVPQDLIREVRTAIALNRLSTERVLVGIDHALDTAGYAMKLTSNTRVIHEEFRKIADRLPGVRAIIAIAEDGTLEIDSYKHPAPAVNLGDRAYVRIARRNQGLYIGTRKIGRTSGIPFLPVAKQVGNHVLAAIVAPHFLIHEEGRCADCVSAILREDGTLIASFPPAVEIPPHVLSLPMVNQSIEGSATTNFSRSDSVVGWRRSELYPFIVMGAKGVRSGAPIGVDDR